jgi:hypothetical protein
MSRFNDRQDTHTCPALLNISACPFSSSLHPSLSTGGRIASSKRGKLAFCLSSNHVEDHSHRLPFGGVRPGLPVLGLPTQLRSFQVCVSRKAVGLGKDRWAQDHARARTNLPLGLRHVEVLAGAGRGWAFDSIKTRAHSALSLWTCARRIRKIILILSALRVCGRGASAQSSIEHSRAALGRPRPTSVYSHPHIPSQTRPYPTAQLSQSD